MEVKYEIEDKPIDKIHEPHRQELLNINTALLVIEQITTEMRDGFFKSDMTENATKQDIMFCVQSVQSLTTNVISITHKLMDLYALHYEDKKED